MKAADDGIPKFKGGDKDLREKIEKTMLDLNPNEVKFHHIIGLDEIKKQLKEEVLLSLYMPQNFKRRNGILFYGPPGNGKTMLAKALAAECGTTFFNVSSSILGSRYTDSERLVQLLFEMAKFYSPSIIFLDEIDSIWDSMYINFNRRLRSEILFQMDEVSFKKANEEDNIVIVLCATNNPLVLDDSLGSRLVKKNLFSNTRFKIKSRNFCNEFEIN